MTKQDLIDYIYTPEGKARAPRFKRELLEKNGFASLILEIETECESVGLGDVPLTDKIRAYCKNQMFSPVCKTCQQPYRFWSNKHQAWAKYCSQACVQNDPEVKAKNFCDDYAALVKKREKTMMEKYGVSTFSQTEAAKEAFVERTKEAWADTERREKRLAARKKSNIEKYGVDGVAQVPEIMAKMLESRKESMAKLSAEQLDEYEKHRAAAYRKSRISSEAFEKLTSYEYMHDLYVTKKTSVIGCSREIGCSQTSILTALEDLGIEYIPDRQTQESYDEIRLFEFVQSLCPTAIRTYKIGKHLDIFIPELKIGFEYNGIYWHSEAKHESDYHANKVDHFYTHDIRYVQIWEDDWQNRQEVVKKFIRNLLIQNDRIGARKTQIVELTQPEFESFMNDNHMQGSTTVSVRLGLVYDGVVVSAMGFREIASNIKLSREGIGYDLARFANTNVTGAFAKLFGHFLKMKNPDFVSSFGDLEIIDKRKNVYLTNGFVAVKTLEPDYRYFDYRTKKREHKFGFRKDKFAKLGYDIDGKTERQLAIEHKLLRCYDSGKVQYMWRK